MTAAEQEELHTQRQRRDRVDTRSRGEGVAQGDSSGARTRTAEFSRPEDYMKRSELEIFHDFYDLEEAPPSSEEKRNRARLKLKRWMEVQPGLCFSPTSAKMIADRLVDIGIFSVANLAATGVQDIGAEFRRPRRGDDQDNPIFSLGHISGLMVMKAHKVADSLAWAEPQGSLERPISSSNVAEPSENKLLQAILPFLQSQKEFNELAASTQKKLGKVFDNFGKSRGRGRQAEEDHASESSDNEGDKDRVDLGYVLEMDPGTRRGVGQYISSTW